MFHKIFALISGYRCCKGAGVCGVVPTSIMIFVEYETSFPISSYCIDVNVQACIACAECALSKLYITRWVMSASDFSLLRLHGATVDQWKARKIQNPLINISLQRTFTVYVMNSMRQH